jgi:hypothetical protein
MTKIRIIKICLNVIKKHVATRFDDGYSVVISKRKTVSDVLKEYGMTLRMNKID